MALETATDLSITVNSADDAMLTLNRVNDDFIEWRMTEMEGSQVTEPSRMPVLTLSLRRPTKANRASKYTIKLVVPLYDPVLTTLYRGQYLINCDIVSPLGIEGSTLSSINIHKVISAFLNAPQISNSLQNLTMPR